MTVSEPVGALLAVQLNAGRVTVQSVVVPLVNVTVPVALEGSAAVSVTGCAYAWGDGDADAVKALTFTGSLLVAGSPSVDEMRAVLVMVPLSPSVSVTGMLMSGNAVPAVIAEGGVYVHVTVCPDVVHAQSALLVALPGVMPAGSVSVTVSRFASVPPVADVPGERRKTPWLPASICPLSLSVVLSDRTGCDPSRLEATT